MTFTRVEDCIHATSFVFNVPVEDILSERRQRNIIEARFAAIYVANNVTQRSTPVLGRSFKRDHTTIMNALQQANNIITRNPEYAEKIRRAVVLAKESGKDGAFVERFLDELMDHARMTLMKRAQEDPLGLLNKLLRDDK